MKHYIFILCCLFVQCQAMENIRTTKEATSLQRIEGGDLPKLVGKYVTYKSQDPDSLYLRGILGDRVGQSDFYRVFVDEHKTTGVARSAQELYYAENDNQ